MTPDPTASPLATRARVGDSAAAAAERAVAEAGESQQFARERAVCERWFAALEPAEQTALVCALARRLPPDFAAVARAAVGSASPNAPAAVANGDRVARFDEFELASADRRSKALSESASAANPAVSSHDGSHGHPPASHNAPGTPSFRPFRPLSSNPGASPFVNSFISPVPKNDLYSQAFAPLGQGQRSQAFTPWSLSQEINRPKSAADASPASPSFAPYQNGPWGQASANPYGGGLDIMSSRGGESKLQPVGKRWASPLRPKSQAPGSPVPGAGVPGASAGSAGAPGPVGGPVPLHPAPGASGFGSSPSSAATSPVVTSARSAAPSSPHVKGLVIGSAIPAPTSGGPDAAIGSGSRGDGRDTAGSTISDTASEGGFSTEPEKVWNGKPFVSSPIVRNSSPYPAKRTVNFMDIELLGDMGAWLRSLRLHKYTENLSNMPWQEVVLLDDEQLEARGVNALGARRKMLKMFEEIRAAQAAGQLPEK